MVLFDFKRSRKLQVSYAFEILFDSDISFLKGLMVLIDHDLFAVEKDSLPDEIHAKRQDCYATSDYYVFNSIEDMRAAYRHRSTNSNIKSRRTVISPQFLILHLRTECLVKLGHSLSSILEAITPSEKCLCVFESILSFFIRRKLQRLLRKMH